MKIVINLLLLGISKYFPNSPNEQKNEFLLNLSFNFIGYNKNEMKIYY